MGELEGPNVFEPNAEVLAESNRRQTSLADHAANRLLVETPPCCELPRGEVSGFWIWVHAVDPTPPAYPVTF